MIRTPRSLGRLLRSLDAAGCAPWQAGDGHWYAPCPTCRFEGRDGLVEIRTGDLGIVVCCTAGGHRPARREAAA